MDMKLRSLTIFALALCGSFTGAAQVVMSAGPLNKPADSDAAQGS